MNLFDSLVTEALLSQPEFSDLKIVVEKELLHHDILRILSDYDFLKDLTFIGGTALRVCYNSSRLSEDLDFTGGFDFSRDKFSSMAKHLTEELYEKYRLEVTIKEPVKDIKNVDTWKVKVETRPGKRNLPAQRINIDICALPSYDIQSAALLNFYGVDMGTEGLILQVQSKEEIFIDKLLAFALRPNRIKNRDLWDIVWLHQQSLSPDFELIERKLKDRNIKKKDFVSKFDSRLIELQDNPKMFEDLKKEMMRFLPITKINQTIEKKEYWDFLILLMKDLKEKIS